MINLEQGMTLYHGSFAEVQKPDLSKCAYYKDFGRGFYLTSSKLQAVSFAKISTTKAKVSGKIPSTQDYGVVSSFRVKDISELKQIVYESADRDWLHCIVGHRKKNTFNQVVNDLKELDLISGKIADDSTNATITAYMANTFGEIGSDRADQICIELLLPNRLENQFCFRSESAIECLEFTGSEKIWMKE